MTDAIRRTLHNLVRHRFDMCKRSGIVGAVPNVSHDQTSVSFLVTQVNTSMKMLRKTFGASRGQQILFQRQERQLGAQLETDVWPAGAQVLIIID